jgi:hypothetical protein
MSPKELIEKAFFGVIGISLALNAYLMKEKVADLNQTMQKIGEKIVAMSIDQAVISNQVDSNTMRVGKHHERLSYVETRVARIDALMEPHRRTQ